MAGTDHRPLANTPMTKTISSQHDNRFGAVLSALYAFWVSRQVVTRNGSATGIRQDSYSIVVFDRSPEVGDLIHFLKSHLQSLQVLMEGNNTSTPDELVDSLIGQCRPSGGTNFNEVLKEARTVMERQWDAQR